MGKQIQVFPTGPINFVHEPAFVFSFEIGKYPSHIFPLFLFGPISLQKKASNQLQKNNIGQRKQLPFV
jgi:hypothetical protein